jgi:hypothetical protein
MFRQPWVAAALFLSLCGMLPAKDRVWTDSTGRTMRAEFVREIDGEVTFLRDGKIVTLPLERLSDRDQQIVRDLAAGKPLPEDPAPVAPAPVTENSATADSPPTAVQPAESTAVKSLTSKPVPIENRTWTDIHGNQVTGKYVRIFGSNVVLLRGGKSVTVKFYELSSEDQEYLRELLTSRGQEGLIPPKVDISSSDNASAPGDGDSQNNVPPGTGNRSPQGAGTVPAISAPEPTSAPPATGGGGYTGPGGSSFPGPGGSSFPGPGGSSFPGPGPSFPPPSGPSYPGPGALGMPGGGSAFPPTGPGSYPPSYPPSTPGYAPQPGYSPPGSGSFPSSSPPGMPGSGSSSTDRFQQQLEESRRQQLDSVQRMQDRMTQQHESLFNRHGSSGECLSCKHNLNDSEMRRSSCPYCGVTWDYEIDQYGNKRQLNNSSYTSPFSGARNPGSAPAVDAATARKVGLVIGVFIGLAVVAGMIIGTIYIIMSIASASSSSQQRHYR